MQNGRGKIFLEFANNFPLASDQEWLATFLSYQEETRLENEKTSQPRKSESVASSLGLPREKPWDEVD